MRIRDYYSQIETIIKDSLIITHFSIDFDEIDVNVGYIKGKLELIDGSFLYFIEYVEIRDVPERIKYKYQWQKENGDLIARWDNVPHHKEIDTFPYHMHDADGVHPSEDVDLEAIIDRIMDEIIV
ncbi:MAG: DUF6516 family protein [Candidatus Methanoperedens sp.]|jgi:hypothetical protein|nr:DUF6516 family protein [Candidatus Methanoperedens sp.]PKL54006.1 MAG: hypothetical protein CVV36_04170 [Candidatus Methanoperedenaceae archaeon HGW-Methanoperedenaceae-1]